jgi:hypothetical protein
MHNLPLVRVHHRRHDDTQDVHRALRDGHQLLTSACTTVVLSSVQRDAPRPVHGSRETGTAVACGGEQLQQLQPPLCDGSVHKDEFLGRQGTYLCVYPRSRLGKRRTQTSYELFAENGTSVGTYGDHIKVPAGSCPYHALLQGFLDIMLSGSPM